MTDPGGMCEWFRAPRRALVPLPLGLAVQDASLVEPASVARDACHMGEIGPGARVAIVGAGAIGILAAASAQAMGAAEVVMVARHPHQHEARERLGTGQPTGGYDVVIETGGSESGIHRAVELARPGATVVHLGVYGDITWPMQESFMKEVDAPAVAGLLRPPRRPGVRRIRRYARRPPELVKMLITHRFPIEDAPEAFTVAQDRAKGVFSRSRRALIARCHRGQLMASRSGVSKCRAGRRVPVISWGQCQAGAQDHRSSAVVRRLAG